MTNLTKEQILQQLAGGTVMAGWSAIAQVGRDQINQLLSDQWLQSYTNQTFIEPMSMAFDLDEGGQLRGEFRNLVFGPPQLYFEEANLLSAVTTVRMTLLSGDYIQHAYLPGSPPVLLRAHSVNEAMRYAVSAHIELKLQQSVSGQLGLSRDNGRQEAILESFSWRLSCPLEPTVTTPKSSKSKPLPWRKR